MKIIVGPHELDLDLPEEAMIEDVIVLARVKEMESGNAALAMTYSEHTDEVIRTGMLTMINDRTYWALRRQGGV